MKTPVWNSLFLGAVAGLIIWLVFFALWVYLPGLGAIELFISPALFFLSAFTVPGLVAGIVSHMSLTKATWVPRFTWLLLALLYFLAQALGIGSLLFGTVVGFAAMTALAIYGTVRLSPENRAPSFLVVL